jgi:hypothetical protein
MLQSGSKLARVGATRKTERYRSRYFSIQVAPQLSSWGWVDPVPDPLLLRKSGSAGNRTRDLKIKIPRKVKATYVSDILVYSKSEGISIELCSRRGKAGVKNPFFMLKSRLPSGETGNWGRLRAALAAVAMRLLPAWLCSQWLKNPVCGLPVPPHINMLINESGLYLMRCCLHYLLSLSSHDVNGVPFLSRIVYGDAMFLWKVGSLAEERTLRNLRILRALSTKQCNVLRDLRRRALMFP